MLRIDFKYLLHIWKCIRTIIEYIWKYVICGVPTSYPGDALKKPVMRRGRWLIQVQRIKKGWKFACDKESHEISIRQIPELAQRGISMTGESAGRQIWYFDADKGRGNGGSEIEEDEMEDVLFSAAINPNSSDLLFRNYMVSGMQPEDIDGDEGAALPPADARTAAKKGLAFYELLQVLHFSIVSATTSPASPST